MTKQQQIENYKQYLQRFANSHATTPEIASKRAICRENGKDNHDLSDEDMDNMFGEGE